MVKTFASTNKLSQKFAKHIGYVATVHHNNVKKNVKIYSGSIHIETDSKLLNSQEDLSDEEPVESQILEKL